MLRVSFKGRFDGKPILSAAQRKEQKALNYAGGYIRRIAQQLMKAGSRGSASAPGDPPLTWTDRLRNSIYYAYDPASRSVVIGAISFAGIPVPGIIEYGGSEMITDRRTGRQIQAHYQPRPAMQIALNMAIQQKKVQAALKDYIEL